MKNTLQQLEKHFPAMSTEQKASIVGGTSLTTTQLNNLFDYTAIGYTSQLAQNFTTEIQTIYNTKMGADVINQILASGNKIVLSSATDTTTGEIGYNGATNTFYLGALSSSSFAAGSQADVDAFSQTAHQIYRAYEQTCLGMTVNDNSGTLVTQEIDAFLFQGVVAFQAGGNYTDDIQNYVIATMPTSYNDPSTGESFIQAYGNIMSTHELTLKDYNTLINQFQGTGFAVSANSATPYASMTATDLPSNSVLEGNAFYNLYGNDYFVPYPTVPDPSWRPDSPGSLPSYIPPIPSTSF